jgi:hypothetical protein
MAEAGLDRSAVLHVIAAALTETPGIALAVPRTGLSPLQETPLLPLIQRNFHEARSGDIYVAQDPYWFLFDKGAVVAMHGSPWRYDRHVPLLFAGPGVTTQTVHRTVHPVDIAPTLAAYLGITAPSSAQGTPLVEVLP